MKMNLLTLATAVVALAAPQQFQLDLDHLAAKAANASQFVPPLAGRLGARPQLTDSLQTAVLLVPSVMAARLRMFVGPG